MFSCVAVFLLSCSSVAESEHLVRPRLVCSCSLLPLQAIRSCHNKDQRGRTYTTVYFLEKRRRKTLAIELCVDQTVWGRRNRICLLTCVFLITYTYFIKSALRCFPFHFAWHNISKLYILHKNIYFSPLNNILKSKNKD